MFETAMITYETLDVQSIPFVSSEGTWGARRVIPTKGINSEVETVEADTQFVLSIQEMAARFGAIGQPTTVEELEISFEPDDYPLF